MKSTIALCVVLLLALSCQAFAVTSYFDTFNGDYDSGPIGAIPYDWNFFGFGAPAWTEQETGIVQPPNDGSDSASRWNVPGSVNGSGTIAIYRSGISLDMLALPGQPIDWNYPVYLKADLYAVDYGSNTKWNTLLYIQSYDRTNGSIEWGNDGHANAQWETITCEVAPGQGGKSGTLVLHLDFDFTGNTFGSTNAAIWDNVRIDYTPVSAPVPEPSSMLALSAGLIGLVGVIRRRR